MKKLILLILCLCLVGCKAVDKENLKRIHRENESKQEATIPIKIVDKRIIHLSSIDLTVGIAYSDKDDILRIKYLPLTVFKDTTFTVIPLEALREMENIVYIKIIGYVEPNSEEVK